MRFHLKTLIKVVLCLYIIASGFTSYWFFTRTISNLEVVRTLSPWENHFVTGSFLRDVKTSTGTPSTADRRSRVGQVKVVDIWGKAAIGLYLWQNIFEGSLRLESPGWKTGEIRVNRTVFRFHTGPAVVLDAVPSDAANVVLVLNGREPSKVESARDWLNYVRFQEEIRCITVVLLGNERCQNRWIMEYMRSAGGPISSLFVVYDSREVDNKSVFQWPLGVATYRSFPVIPDESLDVESRRRYRCNFLGTVYPNSTRENLLRILKENDLLNDCYIQGRLEWLPNETRRSMYRYVDALRDSDLTLNPVGMNAECYRVYEAMSYGSVPVVEDRATASDCGSPGRVADDDDPVPVGSSFRLLKEFDAPVVYVDDWTRLPELLERERRLSLGEVVARRKRIVAWYRTFRRKMRDRLVDVVGRCL